MAERVGFEPTVPLRAQRFSRPSRSATLAPLRWSYWLIGGEGGIRTHGRVSPTHAFQACSLSHSDTSPFSADFSKNRELEARACRAPPQALARYSRSPAKNSFNERARLLGQHAASDLEPVVQPWVTHQITERARRPAETALRISPRQKPAAEAAPTPPHLRTWRTVRG